MPLRLGFDCSYWVGRETYLAQWIHGILTDPRCGDRPHRPPGDHETGRYDLWQVGDALDGWFLTIDREKKAATLTNSREPSVYSALEWAALETVIKMFLEENR